MTKPARTLRAIAQDKHPDDYRLTDHQREREQRILRISTTLLAEAGTRNVTFGNLAAALRIGTATLRFHFCDLDVLLYEILIRYLTAIAAAVLDIPPTEPDRDAKRQAAYRALTSAQSAAHQLLIRDRHLLPPDLLSVVNQHCQKIARALGGANPELTPAPSPETAPHPAPVPRIRPFPPDQAAQKIAQLSKQLIKLERATLPPGKPSRVAELMNSAVALPTYQPPLHATG